LVNVKHPETGRRYWKSIDMVRHRGPDGKEHYYSSKPTLLPTLLAGEYWLVTKATGATLGDQPFLVMRLMLVVTNVLPMLIYFVLLWRLIDRLTTNRLAALYTMAAATWGTFLTTFAVTINNHTVAAISVLLATLLMLHVWLAQPVRGAAANGPGDSGQPVPPGPLQTWWCFAGAGLFAAFAAANELPALSLLACVTLAAFWASWRYALMAFVPAVALVAAGFFGTNYLAHGTVVPAYAHRSDGPVVATVAEGLATQLDDKRLPEEIRLAMAAAGVQLSDQALVLIEQPQQRWAIWDRAGHKRFALLPVGGEIEVRWWENWYDYAGSYWKTERQGVDRGELSRGVYTFHVILGHRSLLSLTPIWLLAIEGMVLLAVSRRRGWAPLGLMVIALTLVCLTFYISRPTIDRNYGGVCCGFRWMFWFIPLWSLCLVPAAERLLRGKIGRAVALLLLLISVFSATYAAANPWSPPWLFDLGTYAGWWSY
jgi:hypothetical protein